MAQRILVVDDDRSIVKVISSYLERSGFQTFPAYDGEMALHQLRRERPDLVILDLMMPNRDGWEVTKIVRADHSLAATPIIMLTARVEDTDKIVGLELGADDYITKPFDEEELLWKIKAVVRRIPGTTSLAPTEIVQIGKYTFDYTNQLISLNGINRRITEKECEILNYLYSQRNRKVRREELLKAIWGENDYFFGRSMDVFISKIRKYLKDDPNLSIENVFGVGFIFNVPEV